MGEKLCIYCIHCRLETAELDYSDETPGSDFAMWCNKDHWRLRVYEDSLATYRRKLETAKTCEDFQNVS